MITRDGELESETITTLLACPGPLIAEQSFIFGRGSCETNENAVVAFADEEVHIEGRSKTPNPCYGLELASVDLRTEKAHDDVLEVTVGATDQQSENCISCLGSVPYTATIAFENAYPSTVEIVHASMDEKRTVTTKTP